MLTARDNREDEEVEDRLTERQKTLIDPRATSILLQIPGMTSASTSWFYMLRVLNPEDDVYDDIVEYVKNGQEHGYGVKITSNIIRVVRNNDKEFGHDRQTRWRFRMMLWHGTKLASIPSILQNGFQLPPTTGQMFGPGIYFADRISKSCNYCDGTTPGSVAYLLLCDVLVGKWFTAKVAHNEFTQPPKKFRREFDSVKCSGRKVPDRAAQRHLPDKRGGSSGSIIPCGPTIPNEAYEKYAVNYNEYIIYDPEKIKVRFIVPVEFTATKCS